MDPFAGEIFSASLGGGAACNFSQMRVGEETTGAEAVVVTGYGATDESADAMIKGARALTARCRCVPSACSEAPPSCSRGSPRDDSPRTTSAI